MTPLQVFCRYCGAPMADDAPQCTECGKAYHASGGAPVEQLTLAVPQRGEPAFRGPTAPSVGPRGTVRCLNCGEYTAAWADYCDRCGQARDGRLGGKVWAHCPQCGVGMSGTAAYCDRCGVHTVVNFAGFWRRTGGYSLDVLVLMIPNVLVSHIVPLFGGMLVGAAYFGYYWTSSGQTLGMRAMGVRVQGLDGGKLTWGMAIGRFFLLMLSFLCLCIGVIWVAFQPQKRGWHDLVTGTEVVRLS